MHISYVGLGVLVAMLALSYASQAVVVNDWLLQAHRSVGQHWVSEVFKSMRSCWTFTALVDLLLIVAVSQGNDNISAFTLTLVVPVVAHGSVYLVAKAGRRISPAHVHRGRTLHSLTAVLATLPAVALFISDGAVGDWQLPCLTAVMVVCTGLAWRWTIIVNNRVRQFNTVAELVDGAPVNVHRRKPWPLCIGLLLTVVAFLNPVNASVLTLYAFAIVANFFTTTVAGAMLALTTVNYELVVDNKFGGGSQ